MSPLVALAWWLNRPCHMIYKAALLSMNFCLNIYFFTVISLLLRSTYWYMDSPNPSYSWMVKI